jgi:hypothetical protein
MLPAKLHLRESAWLGLQTALVCQDEPRASHKLKIAAGSAFGSGSPEDIG